MADVLPFKGLRYNTRTAGEPSQVICPPFDTISQEAQGSLYRRSPYNVVRLEAGERLSSDTERDNRYTRSAALLADWIDRRVLVREDGDAFYLVKHGFKVGGQMRHRLELMSRVRLEEYERRVVLPHEHTRDEDKRDRLALIEACRANFSPIMCLYRDEDKGLSSIFQRAMGGEPIMNFSDPEDQRYVVWKLGDSEMAREITGAMSSKALYIADGHHRYETALRYRDVVASSHSGAQTTDEAFKFVMMGLIGFGDPGLIVLPYHRALGSLGVAGVNRVRERLREIFDVEPFGHGGRAGLEEFLLEVEQRGADRMVLGLLEAAGEGYQLLTLKPEARQDELGPVASSEGWVLEDQVLRPVLGDSLDRCVSYVHDAREAEQRVRSGEFELAFFLKAFPIGLFQTVMDAGQRLPPKSTFFYPKLATGLVINLLEGTI